MYRATQALDDYKANDILVLDVRNLSDATDYFIIASGSSDIHVRSLGNRLIQDLAEEGINPHHVEGLARGQWALIDFVDFVVHVFHPSVREFYQLERLWADAPRIQVQME
ncbi:MAG: ribosome silencing factor [Gemmatimonadales bacterium]